MQKKLVRKSLVIKEITQDILRSSQQKTSMELSTALGVLGLSWNFTRDDVGKAFRKCMLEAHPDKNPDPASLARAQKIVEARDYLLGRPWISERERQEARKRMEEEAVAQDIKKVREWMEEMEFATGEATTTFQAWFKSRTALYFRACCQGCDDWFDVFHEYHDKLKTLNRRERYNATLKKKRKEGSRAHRKTSGYKEGKLFIPQIAAFFKHNITVSTGSRLLASDIHRRFLEMNKGASELEVRLFNRHYKKLLLDQFPDSFYCRHKLQRCFAGVALK